MKISFLLPCYCWVPSGGFRVVYEYANQLVARGHSVTVIHPRRLAFPPPEKFSLRGRLRRLRLTAVESFKHPTLYWHRMDPRVRLEFVADSSARHFPDADVVFATAWHTVASVLALPTSKGKKSYLIQGYETFLGPRDLVNQTWRAPLHKIVIAKWLVDLAEHLGAGPVTYIPNAIDPDRYRCTQPPESRPPAVAMTFSTVPVKGSRDGIAALQIAKESCPSLSATLFGAVPRPAYLPKWISYFWNPPQREIVERIYNQSAIFLSPSLSEGFPLPPAEAASCCCAIVATDIPGMQDYIEPGVTGVLSPPSDPGSLAENICSVLRDWKLRVRLARAAKSRISQFTWERSTGLMESFLERVSAQA